MAATSVRIPVDIDMSRAEKSLRKGLGDKVIKIKLDPKDFNQPLGRITGKLGEFDNALAASNARVIAFGASASAIYAIQRALSATVKSAIEVEKVLADINVILNASGSNLKKFGDQLFRIAGNTGQSFNEVAKAATELARQGLSVSETLKRTNDALVLTRLSGLGATQSVESLTAAINSFNKTAITSTEIINKMANVDAAFAVSSKDLAEAIRRVGSTAADANVSFDELIAAVTSAQQVTARGGAVIGNSFKTIFTRLQRPKVLDALEKLGIQTRSVTGDTRPAIKILKEFAKTYETLAPSIKATTSELIGGVFQINIVKAALADLNKEYSIYDQALKTSVGSTDEAIKRNEALNETMSAMINKTFANLQKVAAGAGEDMFGPMMKRLIGGLNGVLEKLGDDPDTKGVGSKIASGIFKGIGDFLSGPGLMLGAVGLFKIVSRIGATATDAMQSIVLGNKAHEKTKQLKLAAFNMLQKEPGLLERVLNNTMTIEQAHERVLGTIEAETNALRLQMNLAGELARKLSSAGVTVPEAGPFAGTAVTPKGGAKRAGGHKPDWLGETSAMANSGYSLSDMRDPGVRSQKIHDGRGGSFMASVNKHERVQTMKGPGGNKGTFVIPPKDSDAFKKLAEGLVPNFARTTAMRVDSIAKGRPSLHKYINYGEGGSPKSKKGSTRKYAPTKEYLTGSGKGQAKGAKVGRQTAMRLGAKGLSTSTKGMVGFDPMDKFDFDLVMKKVDVFNSPEAQDFIHRKKGGKNLQNWDLFEKYIRTKHLPSEGLGRGTMTAGMGGKYPLDSIRAAGKNIVGEEIKWFDNPRGVINTESGAKGTKEYYMGKALGFAISMGTVGKSPNKPWYNKKSQIGDLGRLNVYHPDSIKPNNEMIKMLGQKGRRSHASGFTPNFFKGKNKNPLYDLDGTIIKEGFFDWKDPNAIRKVTGQDLTPIGQSLLKSGKKFDIATARSLKDKGPIMQHLSSMGLNVGKIFPMASMYTSRTEMGKRGKPIKMTGPTKKGLLASTLGRTLVDNDMRNVDAVRRAGGRATKVSFGGGFVPNFAGASEAMSIFNRKGQQVKSSRVAHDWREMSSSDFEHNYGSKHAADRAAASQAGVPYSKWKQGKERSSRQASIKRISSPHVMLTSDIGLKASRMTVDKRINDKKYKVSFPYGGLRKSPIGASNFKDLIDQELSGGMTNIYKRMGFKELETSLGTKQRPEFSKVMRQSNVDQTLGNMFDGLVKKMIRGSSKLIDDDKASVAWDVPSTSGSIEKAFHTKGGLKGDLKLSAGKEGPSDFAEKVLSDKGIKRKGIKASGFIPSFANGLQKALIAEQMFGGRGASPVVDFSSELKGKGMSGLFVRDKKQKGMRGVKRDHGGLSNALKDAKGMQKNIAKGFIPNFATDDISDTTRGSGKLMMASFMAPMMAQTLGELIPAVRGFASGLGQAASMTGTIVSMWPGPTGLVVGGMVGVATMLTSWSKSLQSKSKEFDKAAGRATEELTNFKNGMQGYLTSLEAFNTATKDSEKSSHEIARIHSNMTEALSLIDSEYQSQLLAAKDIKDAQRIQAGIVKKMTKETQQVKFAAELQKTMDELRDAFSATEIFDKTGNLGKISQGLVKSIGVDALRASDNLDQILTGTQEEVIRNLQAEFKLDPMLVESLGDLTKGTVALSKEFGALMDELRSSKRIIDDTEKRLDQADKLRKKENERLKEFQTAVKTADQEYTHFVKSLRETGDTLSKILHGTMDLKAGAQEGIRKKAAQTARSGLNLVKGTIGKDAFAERMAFVKTNERRGGVAGKAGSAIRGSMKTQMAAVTKAFRATLDEKDKSATPERAREINKANAERMAKFTMQMGSVAGAMQNMDPVADRNVMQAMVTGLAGSIKEGDKQSGLMATLNGIQADSQMKLAGIQQKADQANTLANQQLSEAKQANKNAQRANRLGGIKGFLDPTTTMKPMFKQLSTGLKLMRAGAGRGGGLGTVARGRGAMNVAMAGRDLGLFDEGGAASKALKGMAVPAHMRQQKIVLGGTRRRLMREQQNLLARGDRQGASALGAGIREIGQKMTPEELKKTAEQQIDLELKTGDLRKVNLDLTTAIKELTSTFKGQDLSNTLGGALTSALDGSTLNTSLMINANMAIGITASQTKLAKATDTLAIEQGKSSKTIREGLDAFSRELLAQGGIEAASQMRTGVGTGELLDRNDSWHDWQPTQKAFTNQIKQLTEKLSEGGTQITGLVDLQTRARASIRDDDALNDAHMTDFISNMKESSGALEYFIRSISSAASAASSTPAGGGGGGAAQGYVPNFNKILGYGAERERRMASMGGYTAGGIRSTTIGGERKTYNTREKLGRFPGLETAIMPPQASGAGRNYRSRFGKTHGFNPYAASGYVPNYAGKYDMANYFTGSSNNINAKTMAWEPFFAEGKGAPRPVDSTGKVWDLTDKSGAPRGGGAWENWRSDSKIKKGARTGGTRWRDKVNPRNWKRPGNPFKGKGEALKGGWKDFVDKSKTNWGRRGFDPNMGKSAELLAKEARARIIARANATNVPGAFGNQQMGGRQSEFANAQQRGRSRPSQKQINARTRRMQQHKYNYPTLTDKKIVNRVQGRAETASRAWLKNQGGFGDAAKGFGKNLGKGVLVGAVDYAAQRGFDAAGVGDYNAVRLAPGMTMGAYMGGPVGMAIAAGFTMTDMTVKNIDYSGSVADQIGAPSAQGDYLRGKGSPQRKKLRALAQAKQNIIDQLNQRGMSVDSSGTIGRQGVSQGGILDVFKGGGSDKWDLARQYRQIVEQQTALSRSMNKGGSRSKPGYATGPKARAAFDRQDSMASARRMMFRRNRNKMSDSDYWKSMRQKDARAKNSANSRISSMSFAEHRKSQPKPIPKTPRAKGSLFGGKENVSWTGSGPVPKHPYALSMEAQMIRDSNRHKRKIAQDKMAGADAMQKAFGINNPERDRSIRKSREKWQAYQKSNPSYANGYVPNFQGINDAIGREIRDGGVSSGQVRVHMNPDAVTNTRDEPRGLKDVGNFAASDELKQIVSVLKELLQEAREKSQTDSAKGRKEGEDTGASESVVRHDMSPLNINVSGSIEETRSGADDMILNSLVKAVEKLNNGKPIAPPTMKEE